MKILVIGTNTASDFISQKLLEDHSVDTVYHFGASHNKFPTNRCISQPLNQQAVLDFLESVEGREIDLVIATTLTLQFWSEFCTRVNQLKIPILMPGYKLGKLEWSKVAGKKLLTHLGIPTASYKIMTKVELIKNYYSLVRPFVIKYEQDWRYGLQTIVITDQTCDFEFANIVNSVPSNYPISSGLTETTFVVEEFIEGVREYSWHALCNTTGWQYLGSARDYKKRYENDTGFNTASMGAYSPVPNVDARINEYADKIVEFLIQRGTPYIGILYLGIMIDKNGIPVVLEINTRPGSPEIESILPTIENNLFDLFYKTASNLPIPEVKFNNKSAVSIRIVNNNYNENLDFKKEAVNYPCLWPIVGNMYLSMSNKSKLLHSLITTSADTVDSASDELYRFLKNKPMGDFVYRTDIGYFK